MNSQSKGGPTAPATGSLPADFDPVQLQQQLKSFELPPTRVTQFSGFEPEKLAVTIGGPPQRQPLPQTVGEQLKTFATGPGGQGARGALSAMGAAAQTSAGALGADTGAAIAHSASQAGQMLGGNRDQQLKALASLAKYFVPGV